MYVYHGSPYKFAIAKPNYTFRTHNNIVNYEGYSLHATPYKWIALSYTYNRNKYFYKNKIKLKYSVGVSLSENNKNIVIFGNKNLQYSLKKLFGGKDRYLYYFYKKNFQEYKGLGALEVISYREQIPIKIKVIKNAVKDLIKLGVKFIFIQL